ncbi:MAG: calcineurin-like phosphoesterase C-terminal domain-containing protein [Bacteroidales bacterium]|nr:calcineurin-like phosphoesterase C-terminal domain-containing protein [Bacteroidales bacterium]
MSAVLVALVPALVSCGGNAKEEVDTDKIVTTYVSVPSSVEIEKGGTITLKLMGKTNIKSSDQIVLRTASNQDFVCTITSIKDSESLSFATPNDLVSGNHKIYVRRNDVNHYLGATDITVLIPLDIDPAPGTNVYGIVTCGGKGVPNVLLSDGDVFVKTDANGIYQMKSSKKWKYVFVVIPSGYEVPSQGVLPEFHAALSQDVGVAERRDFELVKTSNDKFTMFVLGDMHLAKRNNDLSQFAGVANTLNKYIEKAGGKTYCLTLGDMTWDLYWYTQSYTFPQYLETVNSHFKNISFFHTMGNHDNDMNSVGDYEKSFRYTRDIAPTFYSFNLGQIHFIVLDNIDYNNVGTGDDNRSKYVLDYTAEQMAWLAKDLSYVDKATPVVITSHAPLSRPNGVTSFNDKYMDGADSGEANMKEFIAAVADYDVHFLSGHTHNIFNRKHSNKMSEHNEGAVCATWWWSGYQTTGVHVSQDGAPGGFAVWEFDGKKISHRYQAAGHDENYQFRAYDMNEVKKVVTSSAGGGNSKFTTYVTAMSGYPDNTILVNVWDYDDTWEVSITENGNPLTVTKDYAYDPVHIMAHSAPRCKATSSPNFLTQQWPHFFKAKASSANSTVVVTVKDRNGKTYTETMSRPKTFNVNDYKNQ